MRIEAAQGRVPLPEWKVVSPVQWVFWYRESCHADGVCLSAIWEVWCWVWVGMAWAVWGWVVRDKKRRADEMSECILV